MVCLWPEGPYPVLSGFHLSLITPSGSIRSRAESARHTGRTLHVLAGLDYPSCASIRRTAHVVASLDSRALQGDFVTEPSGDQTDKTIPPEFVYDPLAPDEPGSGTAPSSPPPAATEPAPASAPDESTIGTGTSLALGCVVATVLLIVIAIIVLGVGAAFR